MEAEPLKAKATSLPAAIPTLAASAALTAFDPECELIGPIIVGGKARPCSV